MKLILKRFSAFFIDLFIFNAVTFPLQIYFMESYGMNKKNVILVTIFVYSFELLYFYISEKYFKTTFGKKIFRLKVETSEESNFFFRTISRLIPIDPFYFLFNDENEFLHDKLSKTRVVEVKKISTRV